MTNGQPEFDFVVDLVYGKKEYRLPVRTRSPKLGVRMAIAMLAADLSLMSDSDRERIHPVEISQVYPVRGRCERCRDWCFDHEVGSRNRRVMCESCR